MPAPTTADAVSNNTATSAPVCSANIIASTMISARAAIAQAIPRWNWPASEYGHGSISRLISRPCSDVVQVDLTGQALQTLGLAR